MHEEDQAAGAPCSPYCYVEVVLEVCFVLTIVVVVTWRGRDRSPPLFTVLDRERCSSASEMERETELTQSWNPELAALNEKPGGLLNGIPLLVGGELKTFSLPVPFDDDGTDISLKDWQLGPRSKEATTPPYSIKPFKGSVRTRFTPIDEDLSSASPRGQSSPDHFETPTTPRTPRTSSSSSTSPPSSLLQEGDQNPHNESFESINTEPHHTGGIAFDVTLDTANKSTRSLRVSFVDNKPPPPHQKRRAPVVRHRSPLKSRSLHPPKETKALQPKWESSTKIRHPITPKPVQAPAHGVRRKKSAPKHEARVTPAREIEAATGDGSSGYLSAADLGRSLGSDHLRGTLDSQSFGYSKGDYGEYNSSNRLLAQGSRDLTMSPNRDLTMSPSRDLGELPRSFGRRQYESGDEDDDDEDAKANVLCGGGLSDSRLSGDFVRLLSKLCRVSVPKQATTKSSRGRSKPQLETSQSWDATTTAAKKESSPVIGRQHSLKLLSEKCSNAPAPTYDALHKPRKIRTHEPHIHFYRTISKTLDQKLKS